MNALKIAFVTPETVPFAKTGGLADVSGALPEALAKLGHNVKLFMPRYRQLTKTAPEAIKLDKKIECTIGEWTFQGILYSSLVLFLSITNCQYLRFSSVEAIS